MHHGMVIAGLPYSEPELNYGRHLDDTRAIGLNVIKDSGANTVDVARRARLAAGGANTTRTGVAALPGMRRPAAKLDVGKQGRSFATLVLRPDLVARHHAAIAAVKVADSALDHLRQALLDMARRYPDLDFAGARDHLAEVGQSDYVDRNFNPKTGILYSLGQADATSDEVDAAWHRAFDDLARPEPAEGVGALELARNELANMRRLQMVKDNRPGVDDSDDMDGVGSNEMPDWEHVV